MGAKALCSLAWPDPLRPGAYRLEIIISPLRPGAYRLEIIISNR